MDPVFRVIFFKLFCLVEQFNDTCVPLEISYTRR